MKETRSDELGYESVAVKEMEVFGFFSVADKFGRDAEFMLDGRNDAAASAAIEFGDDESGESDGGVKFFGLDEAVHARRGIDDDPFFVR